MGSAGLMLVNLGASALGKKNGSSSGAGAYVSLADDRPETVTVPENDGGVTDNARMEAERLREKQQAALRKQQGREVYTSGLGATGLADVSKKTLLGE